MCLCVHLPAQENSLSISQATPHRSQSDTHSFSFHLSVVRFSVCAYLDFVSAFQRVHYSYLYLMMSPGEQRHLFDQALSKLSVFAPVHLREKHRQNNIRLCV